VLFFQKVCPPPVGEGGHYGRLVLSAENASSLSSNTRRTPSEVKREGFFVLNYFSTDPTLFFGGVLSHFSSPDFLEFSDFYFDTKNGRRAAPPMIYNLLT